MSQAVFMSHRTQQKPLVFSATQTKSFLDQKIDVYQQTKIDASSSGRVVTVDYTQLDPMSRGAFYRMYVVWYACHVLSMATSNAAVTTSLAAIRSSISSAQQFEDAYLEYVFTPDTTDLGYYAKDNEMPAFVKVGCSHPAAIPCPTHTTLVPCCHPQDTAISNPKEWFDPITTSIIDNDILRTIGGDISGMSFDMSWSYNGGQGLAGFHFEDGCLPFSHTVFDIQFPTGSSSAAELLQQFSRKTWVYSKLSGMSGIKACTEFFSQELDISYVADAPVASRTFIINPRSIDQQHPLLGVLHQYPGEIVIGDGGHSVTGGALFSIANNFLPSHQLTEFLRAELDLAAMVRENYSTYLQQRTSLAQGQPPQYLRSFALGARVVYYAFEEQIAGREVPKCILDAVKCRYMLERIMCSGISAQLLMDDADVVSTGDIDHQCAQCGLSCVYCMYQPQGSVSLLCALCTKAAAADSTSFKVLCLIPGFIATRLGWM
jgi:hypothetical protein